MDPPVASWSFMIWDGLWWSWDKLNLIHGGLACANECVVSNPSSLSSICGSVWHHFILLFLCAVTCVVIKSCGFMRKGTPKRNQSLFLYLKVKKSYGGKKKKNCFNLGKRNYGKIKSRILNFLLFWYGNDKHSVNFISNKRERERGKENNIYKTAFYFKQHKYFSLVKKWTVEIWKAAKMVSWDL